MFHLSLSQLPTTLGLIALIMVLFYKRHTLTARDYCAAILAAVLVFCLLSGALMQVHVPDVTVHLFRQP